MGKRSLERFLVSVDNLIIFACWFANDFFDFFLIPQIQAAAGIWGEGGRRGRGWVGRREAHIAGKSLQTPAQFLRRLKNRIKENLSSTNWCCWIVVGIFRSPVNFAATLEHQGLVLDISTSFEQTMNRLAKIVPVFGPHPHTTNSVWCGGWQPHLRLIKSVVHWNRQKPILKIIWKNRQNPDDFSFWEMYRATLPRTESVWYIGISFTLLNNFKFSSVSLHLRSESSQRRQILHRIHKEFEIKIWATSKGISWINKS